MRLLLDTHVFVWIGLEPERLSERAVAAIEESGNERYFSIASAWEMAIKTKLKKLNLEIGAKSFIKKICRDATIDHLAVSLDHVLATSELPDHHHDPFDRLLAAQAKVEGLTLVTADPHLHRYAINTLW